MPFFLRCRHQFGQRLFVSKGNQKPVETEAMEKRRNCCLRTRKIIHKLRLSNTDKERLAFADVSIEAVECAPPTGDFSPRFEGSTTGGFGLLNLHLVFLWG